MNATLLSIGDREKVYVTFLIENFMQKFEPFKCNLLHKN